MTEFMAAWMLIVLALSLACNLAYICRDMARESRRERQRAQKTRRDRQMMQAKEKAPQTAAAAQGAKNNVLNQNTADRAVCQAPTRAKP